MEPTSEFTTDPEPSILLLGDSLTQYSFSEDGGWGSKIADKLQRRCDIVSRGMSGYNTRTYRHFIPQILAPFQQQANGSRKICGVTLMLGANDSASKECNAYQHVPVTEFEDNLVAIVNEIFEHLPHLKSNDPNTSSERVVIISPPPVDEEAWGKHCITCDRAPDRFNHMTLEYAKACRRAAERAKVQFVDFYGEATKIGAGTNKNSSTPGPADFFTDGLHLGKDGANLLASILWPSIDKITANVHQFLPYWKDLGYIVQGN